eukprot:COSAG06_NODE_239_length_19404_cov_12.723284_24_plen_244_part_00
MAACCDRALGRQDDGSAAEVSGQAAEYLRLAVWLAMLVAGWLLQKGLCEAGWPEDCASDCDEQFSWGWSCVGLPWAMDRLGEAKGLQQLLIYGFFSGWLNAAGRRRRFCYLFSLSALQVPPVQPLRGSMLSSRSSTAGAIEPGELEPLLIANEGAARRAALYGLSWRQRWRLPWFPIVFFATIPVFSRITSVSRSFHFSLLETVSVLLLLHVPSQILCSVRCRMLGCMKRSLSPVLVATNVLC